MEKSKTPAEFEAVLTIEQQAEKLSPTHRERFLATMRNGMYEDDESRQMLYSFYRLWDELLKLEAAEEANGGPVVSWRGRLVPSPYRRAILDCYREGARYFRLLGLDQAPRSADQPGLPWGRP